MHKKPVFKKPDWLHPIPPGKRVFQVICGDHLEPFETTAKKTQIYLEWNTT